MKTKKCISIFSLTMAGLLIGAPQVLASPLLDSDLASFTAIGASSERYIPKIAGEGLVGRSASVGAIVAINASPANAGLANPVTGGLQGAGAAVMPLVQALHSAGIVNPGPEVLARPTSSNAPAAVAGNLPRSPSHDNRDPVRKFLCAMAQANMPIAAFDPDHCKNIAAPDDFLTVANTPDIAVNPSVEQHPAASKHADSDRNTGELTEDLQRALLLAKLPIDLGADSDSAGGVSKELPIQSSSPDIATAFAAFPSALVIDELAATVPEPAMLILVALGLAGIGYKRKRAA